MNQKGHFDQEAAILRSLLRLSFSRQKAIAWQNLEDASAIKATTATFFLLDVHPRWDVERFAVYTLRRILQNLSRKTERLQVEYRGQVRGRIAWPATYKARYGQDFDPSRYVCREVRHQYDTPENQLLRYLTERIDECVKAIPAVLRGGLCYFSISETGRTLSAASRLGDMEAALNQFRRTVYIRQVTLPPEITDNHLLAARTAKMDEYRSVARIYDRYREVVLTPSREKITEIGKRILPLPSKTGGDADLWLELGAEILRA